MKVLLVQPPVEDFFYTQKRSYPLGLLYLATRLREIADVEILDLRVKRVLPAPNPFPEVGEFYRSDIHSPFSLFKGYKRFGLCDREIRGILEEKRPDFLCISSLFSAYSGEALEVARIAKELNPKVNVVLGGHHPSSLPDMVLREEYIDYVIRGEGETPLFQLVDAVMSKRLDRLERIKGLCFKSKGSLWISDSLNFENDIDLIPQRDLLDHRFYRTEGKSYCFMVTSRGCQNSCSFCANMKVPYRERSLRSIEEELEAILSMKIDWIDFEDDMLGGERLGRVMDLLKGKGLLLSMMNGIYPRLLSKDLLWKMKDSGFIKLNISLVDLNESLCLFHGREPLSNIDEILSSCKDLCLDTEVHFIVGLPGQRREDLLKTMCFLSQRRCLLGPSVYYLHPMNPLNEEILGPNWKEKVAYMRSSTLLSANGEFSRLSLFTVLKLCRFINLVKREVDKAKTNLGLAEIKLSDPIERECFDSFLKERKFKAYDRREGRFVFEPCDNELLSSFFELMKGKRIVGYRTSFYVEFVS